MAVNEIAQKLLEATFSKLLELIESDGATDKDFKNAISLLKENGITCDVTAPGNAADTLADALPFDGLHSVK